MGVNREKWTIRDRVEAILQQKKPDRLPFIDRMDPWYKSHRRAVTLPKKYNKMSLNDVHKAVGIGRLKFSTPYAHRLRGVEVIGTFNDQEIYREYEPVMEYFPGTCWAPYFVPRDKPGDSFIEFITPVGNLRIKYSVSDAMVTMGELHPYLKEHPIKEEMDYMVVEYVLERTEFVPLYENVSEDQTELGENGYAVPYLHRIPFQQVLIEYLGEISTFYAIYDSPKKVKRLIDVLDKWLTEVLYQLSELKVIYVEFPDNLDGIMTNPNLFKNYCLPYYQNYAEILHGQGKKVGSHTDGNLKPLINLLAESGLDVCESFTPEPLTECTFEEAWQAWKKGPLMWGGIPSSILEEQTSNREFKRYVRCLLKTVGDHPIILGIGDLVMANNLIERVEYIAHEVENHVLN